MRRETLLSSPPVTNEVKKHQTDKGTCEGSEVAFQTLNDDFNMSTARTNSCF